MKFHLVLFIVLVLVLTTNSSCSKKYSGPTPTIYGHGGIALSPEREVYPRNSDQSILYALDVLNADGVEVDVQMTKDSVLVIYRDNYLDDITSGSGCINNSSFENIQNLTYLKDYKILKLESVLDWTNKRNKKIYLDIKQYNFCESEFIDFTAFNSALNNTFNAIDNLNKNNITANCRDINILNEIEDDEIYKSFETDDILLGISFVIAEKVHKLGIRLGTLNTENVAEMKNEGIEFMIFDVKTNQDIKTAGNFVPNEIITDNISATRKYFY